MKIQAPEYYKEFKCIADKCRHSCCIGWEIDIDSDAAEKYLSMTEGYGKAVAQSIDTDETPHFKLTQNDRCPHLAQNGLCKIILELGEDSLCEICREHPRFYNLTSRGPEVGIGISCEEACRIVLSSDGYMSFTDDGEWEVPTAEISFDGIKERTEIFKILSDRNIPYSERLSLICRKYEISLASLTDGEWKDVLEALEYLDENHKALFLSYTSFPKYPSALEPVLERALAYFIYRHASAQETYCDFVAALGFGMFCERLLASLTALEPSADFEQAAEYARIISEELEYSEENTEAVKLEFRT